MVESDANDVSQSLPASHSNTFSRNFRRIRYLSHQRTGHYCRPHSSWLNGTIADASIFHFGVSREGSRERARGRSGDGQDRRDRHLGGGSEDELMDDAFLAELDFLEASAIMQDGLCMDTATTGGDDALREHSAQQAVGRRLWRLHPVPETWAGARVQSDCVLCCTSASGCHPRITLGPMSPFTIARGGVAPSDQQYARGRVQGRGGPAR